MAEHTTPLSAEQLAEIRAREQAATPGPWTLDDSATVTAPDYDTIADVWEPTATSGNGAFIAAAREDVPALLAEIERLKELWADVARMARSRWKEANGRREHGLRLRAELDAVQRRYAEAVATVARLEQRRVELEKRLNADHVEREELRRRVAELERQAAAAREAALRLPSVADLGDDLTTFLECLCSAALDYYRPENSDEDVYAGIAAVLERWWAERAAEDDGDVPVPYALTEQAATLELAEGGDGRG